MSDYQTDWLDDVERRAASPTSFISRPEAIRLCSEVRRYRDEESDHVSAKYWAEVQRLRAEIAELIKKAEAMP